MRKFKLIKEYPGSPKLGSVVEESDSFSGYKFEDIENSIFFITPKRYVENNPEYWEEIFEDRYIVFTDVNHQLPYKVLITEFYDKKNYDHTTFNSREEAEAYIFYNKPCLSLMDVLISFNTECCVSIEKLNNLVESKQNGK